MNLKKNVSENYLKCGAISSLDEMLSNSKITGSEVHTFISTFIQVCSSNISVEKNENLKCQRYKKLHSLQLVDYSVFTNASLILWIEKLTTRVAKLVSRRPVSALCVGGCNPQLPRGLVRTTSPLSLYYGCVIFVVDYVWPCRVWIHKPN